MKTVLELKYDNTRTRQSATIFGTDGVEQKTALELFSEFFLERNNAEMTETQSEYVKKLIEQIEEEDV